ncbi:hypothetical protein RHGRI_002280 [Rhododendron griersonianum]|uniref:Uncharacterized protein n=1 Tax=Rhododendron griersonianum TaxID=479676 RepID=A0AAV6LP81_9ERIC|nr:hypothetical protein RHGRI_002280 [Rhododendron griersonianum]
MYIVDGVTLSLYCFLLFLRIMYGSVQMLSSSKLSHQKITDFCNDLKKLATRAKESENAERGSGKKSPVVVKKWKEKECDASQNSSALPMWGCPTHDKCGIIDYSSCFFMEGDVQSQSRNNVHFACNVDELSAADISSQSFGLPNMSFKPGCSTDITIRDAGVLGGGLRPSLSARLRECKHTQRYVQKRGSVGRTIDVSRYKGYDELRHDLARRFGIEGQLEDSHRTEWKLVYVDHEKTYYLLEIILGSKSCSIFSTSMFCVHSLIS